jgi:uncharacterized NAD(P)/FAD-binding protein YdhS
MRTVLIIGAGFSGAACAVHLLHARVRGGLRLIMVNRSGAMARGLAYGTQSRDHLLNVPAGNMSAMADDPGHFLRYCQRRDAGVSEGSFVSRRLYGDYLEWMLREAERSASAGTRLTRVVGEVCHLTPETATGRVQVRLADGQQFSVDRVVLGFGNLAPRTPTPALTVADGPHYVRDPWAAGALDALDAAQPLILLGTGLTAVDVAARLLYQHPGRRLYTVSRRGLLPQAHRERRGGAQPGAITAPSLSELGMTVRSQMRTLRRRIAEAEARGQDWRDVIGALRPITAQWWQGLPSSERGRFLRHLQPYWDTHRHRMAPQAADAFAGAVRRGVVLPIAARLESVIAGTHGLEVAVRPRGQSTVLRLAVGAVINCTGPDSDLRRAGDVLVRQLLDDGLIAVDHLGLGLEVTAAGAVLDAQGQTDGRLFYVGPLLKARDWEATAVPELRRHAQTVAQTIAASFD